MEEWNIASHNSVTWRVPVSAGRRDAFRRFNAVGTETPSRFGGRRYGRATNPGRRFEERFQYGSGVRLAERKTSVPRLMKPTSELSFDATHFCDEYICVIIYLILIAVTDLRLSTSSDKVRLLIKRNFSRALVVCSMSRLFFFRQPKPIGCYSSHTSPVIYTI